MKSTNEETASGGEEFPDDTKEMKTFNIVCTIIKIILTLSIVCGNGMAICTIAIFRTLRTHNGTMLLVLSIADLAVSLLACPLHSVFYLDRGGLLCNETANLVGIGVLILVRAVSIHCILLFTLHHLVDVAFPFRQNCWKNTVIINVLRVMLWAYSITLATLPLTGWNNVLDKKCALENTLSQLHDPLVSFVKVTTLVCLCGYISFLALSLVYRRGNTVRSTMLSKRIAEWKWRLVSDRFVILILLFRIILWLPYILMALLKNEYLSWNTAEMVAVFAGSLLNPIMYAIASSDFLLAFKTLLSTPVSNWPRLVEHPLVSGMKLAGDKISRYNLYVGFVCSFCV